jgi:predicted amidophosphoribosyltransferase
MLQTAIQVWKFSGRLALSPVLIDIATKALARCTWADRIDAFVPVPQVWSRWFRRRFHPAGELAAGVAAVADKPVWPVLRARLHRPQVGLDERERVRNVQGAFRMARRVDLAGRTVCLVDDVATTGATLASAAEPLLAAGANEVYALVLAAAVDPTDI